jgi:hypothetical protein
LEIHTVIALQNKPKATDPTMSVQVLNLQDPPNAFKSMMGQLIK